MRRSWRILVTTVIAVGLCCAAPAGAAQGSPLPPTKESVVDATMAICHNELQAISAPQDDLGRDLAQAMRTWRELVIELLRATGGEPWSSQVAFVSAMRLFDARGAFDAAIARALARPRSDPEVTALAACLRAFTQRGASPVHAVTASDAASIDAALVHAFGDVAVRLEPFGRDGRGEAAPDADLWPAERTSIGSTRAVEELAAALKHIPPTAPWAASARHGCEDLRTAAAIAAFRPMADRLCTDALAAIRLERLIETVAWLSPDAMTTLRSQCAEALAGLDRPARRQEIAERLAALHAMEGLIEHLGVLCAGRGGKPPLSADGAARCVDRVLANEAPSGRIATAAVLARTLRVRADDLPGTLPNLTSSILRPSFKARSALVAWLTDGVGAPEQATEFAQAQRAADDLELLARAASAAASSDSLGARAHQAALRALERAGDGLRAERTREEARAALLLLTERLGAWATLPGEPGLLKPGSPEAVVAGPTAARLAARIERTRTEWAATLARPTQAGTDSMELLHRVMVQVTRLAALGLDDDAVLKTSARVARWAAWCPSADGTAVTIAPLRPRILLACAAAAEGAWEECAGHIDVLEREMPLAEFVAVVAARLGPALADEPTISATIRSIAQPVHEGSWLAPDRARLSTLARAWRELRHATDRGAKADADGCSAVAGQVARDVLASLHDTEDEAP